MKYEYMTYHIPHDVNGTIHEHKMLEKHDKEGWELVAVTPYYYTAQLPDGVTHYYRRPL